MGWGVAIKGAWKQACCRAAAVTHLGGNLGAGGGEGIQAAGGDIVADRLVDGTVHTVGEEHALGLWVAQEEDVQDLLGGPREGEAAHVRRDDVHPAVRHSDCARVSVH